MSDSQGQRRQAGRIRPAGRPFGRLRGKEGNNMPTRLIKESVCTSETLNQLTWFQEVFFYRLITLCDDYGRMDARPAILKGRMFPLKEELRSSEISKALDALESSGLIRRYEADGKPFLQVTTWDRHQNVRAKKSRYPEPADICIQMHTDVSKCSRNPNPNPNPNPETATTTAGARAEEGPFGLTEDEITQAIRMQDAIEQACRTWGLPADPGNIGEAVGLAHDYGLEWLLEAIRITGQGPRKTWGYVRGVLKRARETGRMELPDRYPAGKTVAARDYTQRDYSESDLEEQLGVNELFSGG